MTGQHFFGDQRERGRKNTAVDNSVGVGEVN